MINPFVVKKWGAFLLTGVLTTIFFFSGLVMFNFIYAIAFMVVGVTLSAFIANILIKNPFSLMLEGKGVLFFDITSTGIIKPFIMRVKPPFVEGIIDGKFSQDIFDRDMVYNLAPPLKGGEIQQGIGEDKQTRTLIVLSEEDYNRGRFGLQHFPVVLWNSQLKTILTKDWLSEQEKTSFTEHQILYLNRKVEELTNALLNFGRYVVESTKPKKFLNIGAGWIMIIIIILAVILVIIFVPALWPAIQQAMGTVRSSSGTASGTIGSINPR